MVRLAQGGQGGALHLDLHGLQGPCRAQVGHRYLQHRRSLAAHAQLCPAPRAAPERGLYPLVWAAPCTPGQNEVQKGSRAWVSPPANLCLRAVGPPPTSAAAACREGPSRKPPLPWSLQGSGSVPTPPRTPHIPRQAGSGFRMGNWERTGCPKAARCPPGSSRHTEPRMKPWHRWAKSQDVQARPPPRPQRPGGRATALGSCSRCSLGDVLGLRVLTGLRARPFCHLGSRPQGPEPAQGGLNPGMLV